MFQGAMSASAIGFPNLTSGLARLCVACWAAHPATASAAATATTRLLGDRIFYLPGGADRPRLNAVMMLHEADDGAHLGEFLHARLDVTRVVHGAAGDI